MKKLIKIGILVVVIGFSFLAGTIYRSTQTYGIGLGGIFGLAPHSWNTNSDNEIALRFLAPRDLRMEAKTNMTLDVYILDAEGMKLWASDATLNPIFGVKGVTQEIFKLQLARRDAYGFLLYNPTDSTAYYELHLTVYGFEQDLIWVSVAFIVAGFVVIVASFIVQYQRK